MVQAINEALHQKMHEDESVLVLGQDVGVDGGVFRATIDLYESFGEERVIDMPLAESSIVGAAIGMAMNGLRPVAEIQFMGFIYQGFDQVLNHAARLHHRSQGRFSASIVVRAPYGAGVKALEHHSESTEAHFAHLPGIKVVIPSTPADAKGLLVSAIEDPDPVVFLEPKRLYRLKREEVPENLYRTPLGEAAIAREGGDVTIVAYGGMMPVAIDAARELSAHNIEAEVVDLRTILPFDIETIIASVKKTGRLIIVHEAPRLFGVGAEIAAQVAERCLLHLLAPIKRVTGYDIIPPLSRLEDYNYPNAEKIIRAVHETLEF